MILYHGTCDAFVPDIKRDGLIPQKHKLQETVADDIMLLFVAPERDHNAVYLTASLETAKAFAKFRADYEREKYNGIVRFGFAEKRKLSHEIIPTANPVIVEVHLPETWKRIVKPDM